ncbi:GRIP and coiled-coil domain-containing protein 2 [Halocaridina rubra]|uniref:GRIP and coiled-coil domain-containing protein 2 n=1 Tax=Halocaridina rubra TaxID=373956 RepID=A0AAN8ZP57_HALRR
MSETNERGDEHEAQYGWQESELSALRAEHSFLQSEKEGIVRQLSSLSDDLNKREIVHRERISNLETKMESKVSEYQIIISNMSSQNETMSNSFKLAASPCTLRLCKLAQLFTFTPFSEHCTISIFTSMEIVRTLLKQLETVRQNHSREIEDLMAKLEDTEEKLWQLKNTISSSSTSVPSSTTSGLAVSHSLRSEPDQMVFTQVHSSQNRRQPSSHGYDEPRIDVTNMVREDGEGSEWVEPAVHRSYGRPGGYSPPPLEQLISSPMPSNVGLAQQDDAVSVASINTDATSKEIARLEVKLSSGEMRIHQLTTLLHESEAENAKLVQLSDALKEEIRRSTRNESREKHLENMEYMKNIILKFLVMKSGEERKHMVPVLKTVLQLSPQETSDLEHLAVGGEEGSSPHGWGSYLHLWSSR